MITTVALEVTCFVNESRKLYRELTRERRSYRVNAIMRSLRRYFTIWNNVQIVSVVFLLVGAAGHAFSSSGSGSDSDAHRLLRVRPRGEGAKLLGCALKNCSGGSGIDSDGGALLVQSWGAAGAALKLLGKLPGSA